MYHLRRASQGRPGRLRAVARDDKAPRDDEILDASSRARGRLRRLAAPRRSRHGGSLPCGQAGGARGDRRGNGIRRHDLGRAVPRRAHPDARVPRGCRRLGCLGSVHDLLVSRALGRVASRVDRRAVGGGRVRADPVHPARGSTCAPSCSRRRRRSPRRLGTGPVRGVGDSPHPRRRVPGLAPPDHGDAGQSESARQLARLHPPSHRCPRADGSHGVGQVRSSRHVDSADGGPRRDLHARGARGARPRLRDRGGGVAVSPAGGESARPRRRIPPTCPPPAIAPTPSSPGPSIR